MLNFILKFFFYYSYNCIHCIFYEDHLYYLFDPPNGIKTSQMHLQACKSLHPTVLSLTLCIEEWLEQF